MPCQWLQAEENFTWESKQMCKCTQQLKKFEITYGEIMRKPQWKICLGLKTISLAIVEFPAHAKDTSTESQGDLQETLRTAGTTGVWHWPPTADEDRHPKNLLAVVRGYYFWQRSQTALWGQAALGDLLHLWNGLQITHLHPATDHNFPSWHMV